MNIRILNWLIILLAAGFILNSCSSSRETATHRRGEIQKPPPKPIEEAEREFIKDGKIKSIDKISFDYDDSGKLINGEKQSTINYEPDGLMEETLIYGKNSQVDNIYKYSYDGKNFRIQTIRLTPDNQPDKKYTYEYNESGNKIKSVRYDLDGKMEKYYIYQYGDDQKLKEEDWYDVSGKLEYKIKYEYNDYGKQKSATTYNGTDKMLYRYEFRYGPKGNVIEERRFDEDNKPIGVIQYVYKYYGE